jgi:hypothetical protein
MTMASFPLLIEAALRALLVALVVWAGLRLLRVGNVMAQKMAWALVLAAAVAMPLLMRWQGIPAFALLRVSLPVMRSVAEPAAPVESAQLSAPTGDLSTPSLTRADSALQFAPAIQSASVTGNRFPAPSISKGKYGNPLPAPSPLTSPDPASNRALIDDHRVVRGVARAIAWQSFAGFLYFAVAGALIVRVILGLAAALKLWLGAEPVCLEDDRDHFPGLHLRSSRAIASPVTIGSVVLLPADYLDWDAEKLRIVLAHERSHIRQGDFYLQLLAAFYTALFWFSPLGWWLKNKLRNLGEAIGDHAALNQAASPASYAQLLLEFAALPRPTLIGVAMARPSTISQRIERLLNDSAFRKAFADGKRRALLAILIVPGAIFAATAFVRVEAGSAAQTQAPSSAAPAAPSSPASAPTPADAASADAAPQAPAAAPGAEPASGTTSGADSAFPPHPPQAPAVPGKGDQPIVPAPPVLLIDTDGPNPPDISKLIVVRDQAQIQAQVDAHVQALAAGTYKMLRDSGVYQLQGPDSEHSSYSYVMSKDGDSYAIVSGPDAKVNFSGSWNGAKPEDIEKARKMAHGKFLWFSHNGKSYIVEDPAVMAQLEAMYAPIEFLGSKEAELGRREADLGKLEGELDRQMGRAKITAPDISKEMAQVTAAMSKLQSEMGKQISREELAELQGKLAELQGKLGALAGNLGSIQSDVGGRMGALGEEQGKLGAEQGKLGAEQGKLAREADQKTKAIIDESLKDGKAKPVE